MRAEHLTALTCKWSSVRFDNCRMVLTMDTPEISSLVE
jgi:hypothetical protein